MTKNLSERGGGLSRPITDSREAKPVLINRIKMTRVVRNYSDQEPLTEVLGVYVVPVCFLNKEVPAISIFTHQT